MLSEELIKFNDTFPNSKYREIRKQFTGQINSDEDKRKYQASKAPISANIYSFDEIKDTENRIGWIVPKEYIVIDIDNKKNCRVVFDILQALKVKFSFMTGKKGGHFIFKNERGVKSISAGQYCSLGFVVDVRCMEKGYIVLPHNDTDRKWGEISNDIDDVPYFLIPLKNFKSQTDFVGMGEGDGRNDALLRHIHSLIDYAKELTLSEKCESVKLINAYLFSTPMSAVELDKTVLRDEIVNKDGEEKDKEQESCFEERLADRIVKDKQIITVDGDCYMYNGKVYQKVLDLTEIERIIHLEYCPTLKAKQRVECVKFIQLKSYVPSHEVDKYWNEIVFRNGILNLSTKQMIPHTPSKYNTVYIDCNYIKDAPYSKKIDDFFNDISTRDEDKKNLLYEIVGYSLVRKILFQKFFICYGRGGTGKSTYLRLITNLVGNKNCSFNSFNDLEETYMPAELFGKLVNIGDDIEYRGMKETAVLKKLVSGEMFAAQRKYKTPLHFSNFAKLIFTANKLPDVHDRTSGFYRRVMIIDIDKKISRPDIYFLERLTDYDYEYLLSVAIEKLSKAMERNALTECVSTTANLERYMTEQSTVLSFIDDQRLKRNELIRKSCSELYQLYKTYCIEGGSKPLKKINFDKEICEYYSFTKRNTTNRNENKLVQCWRYVDIEEEFTDDE